MIPKVNAYEDSSVSAKKTRFDIEELLEKKFKITRTIWRRDDPENTYFGFQYTPTGMDKPLTFKVQVPFIEKMQREQPKNRYSKQVAVYNEDRSYRFFYHIFKAMMLNTDIGMNLEQIMSSYLVVGQLADGTPVNVMDKVLEVVSDPERKALTLQ